MEMNDIRNRAQTSSPAAELTAPGWWKSRWAFSGAKLQGCGEHGHYASAPWLSSGTSAVSPGRCKPVRLIKIGPQNLAVRMNDACGRSDSSGGDSSRPTRSTTSSHVIRSAVGEPIYYPGSPSLLFLTVQWE
ncbi:hypothetical protein HPP92_017410 [Vanilla planifolia]|uniref:Uncharacterized protein n=1 Tax=Vanilla planifolia TaxID=51239 RepID=A0A835US85_VANPL|nr:hypothetical protein HPP92_017410 [Vanilla planifolia]